MAKPADKWYRRHALGGLNLKEDDMTEERECVRCCTPINDQNMAITNSLMGDPFTDNDYHCIDCYREITKDWVSKPTL